MRRRTLFLVLSALPALLAAPANAAPVAKKPAPTRKLPIGVEARPHRPYRLNWTYPRFRTWQYVASTVTSGVNFYFEFAGPDYPDQRTRGPVPLDSSVRSWLRFDNPRKAQRVAL